MRHGQACQLLLTARSHGPFRTEGYEVRITADFLKETNDHRKAFLSTILPALEEWMAAMIGTSAYERVIYHMQDQATLFEQMWVPFLAGES
ncbi:hypothetical protein NDU88_004462 [Pleurodeles waltl]|uniref:Uncharacterized protein n=1 Tax=Pleurodeles waltl TaxID=8319 RepID=A0AAV7NL43_PLEWA|nr:hypothetical protein NDU88_004462 [Pleurodeles waltl]